MLFGDRAKYFGLVGGVTFATLLMAQQVSIFIGLMARTASAIYDVSEVDLWVMDPRVRYVEELEPLREIELSRVRSVEGVAWAVPFYKGVSSVRLSDGVTQQMQVIGVDEVTLVGMCPKAFMGERSVVQHPRSAVIDRNGYIFTWPKQPFVLGREVELNDNRITIDGICEASPTFLTFPILYLSYQAVKEITPPIRNKMSFVLVKGIAGTPLSVLAKKIHDQTGLQVLTTNEFAWRSIGYILERTGIPINFGITVALGVIIGAAITAQTFHIFVVENLKQFAAMKAIGVTNMQLLKLVLLQAAIVASVGYGIGIGLTAVFFKSTAHVPALSGFILRWQVVAGTGVIITIIVLCSILLSLRKVFTIDPAIVFRG